MRIQFHLSESDFLSLMLYNASQSELVRKKRVRTQYVFPVLYGLISIYSISKGQIPSAILFVLLGIGWFFFYPIYEKRRYIKFYKRHIAQNFASRIGEKVTIEFSDDTMHVFNDHIDTHVSTSELIQFTELPDVLLLHLKNKEIFIFPKDQLSKESILFIDDFSERLAIEYHEKLTWKWQ